MHTVGLRLVHTLSRDLSERGSEEEQSDMCSRFSRYVSKKKKKTTSSPARLPVDLSRICTFLAARSSVRRISGLVSPFEQDEKTLALVVCKKLDVRLVPGQSLAATPLIFDGIRVNQSSLAS